MLKFRFDRRITCDKKPNFVPPVFSRPAFFSAEKSPGSKVDRTNVSAPPMELTPLKDQTMSTNTSQRH